VGCPTGGGFAANERLLADKCALAFHFRYFDGQKKEAWGASWASAKFCVPPGGDRQLTGFGAVAIRFSLAAAWRPRKELLRAGHLCRVANTAMVKAAIRTKKGVERGVALLAVLLGNALMT